MLLLIDNYDSFTYNLVHAFQAQGENPVVVRNDEPKLLSLASNPKLKAVCLSPGPSNPKNAGLCLEFLARLPKQVPVLGVCLGHQILGHYAGAKVEVNAKIMHGKQSGVLHQGKGLFNGLASPMTVGRYHSLVVNEASCPEFLQITARTEEGEVMGLEYKDRPWAGVQFHPESILTPQGDELLGNFVSSYAGVKALSGKISGSNGSKNQINKNQLSAKHGGSSHAIPLQISHVIEALAQGRSLDANTARQVFNRLMDGELSAAQAGALLLGLRAKGETSVELQSAAEAILERAISIPKLETVNAPIIDVVGTGGDSKFSFNCSTATALVLAGLGHKVLKHGNRSVSSRCGSADVLEKLGVPLNTAPNEVAEVLKQKNFVFLFAVNMHPAFKHIMPARRELGIRTLFNMLGPLTNPGKPTHRLIGVAQENMVPLLAGALAKMGVERGAVVYGSGGYDELTPIGPAQVAFIERGEVEIKQLEPLDYGFARCQEEDLLINDPDQGCAVLKELLQGRGPKPMAEMLAFNVGLGLYLLNKGQSLGDSMEEAKQAIAKGAGRGFVNA